MNKIAFIFPGQGSQTIGMGISLAEKLPAVAALYQEASSLLGWNLLETCKLGPEDRLKQTDIAQPALYVTGYAAFIALQQAGLKPQAVAGHSIGEYAALAAASVFSFPEGLSLVRERGKLMQSAAEEHPGSMAAILGLTAEQVEAVCRTASSAGICVPVNFNSPEQIVIAGDLKGLEAAEKTATEAGAKRVIRLNVAGAFHSPLMKQAAETMKAQIAKISFRAPHFPIVMNVDGQSYTEPSQIQVRLSQQLDHSVQWVRTIETLAVQGVADFIEAGPGRVLTGLLKRINKQLKGYSTESWEALEQTKEALLASQKGIL